MDFIKQNGKIIIAIFVCWTFLALLFTPQTYLANLSSPTPLSWGLAVLVNLILFYTWAYLTPLVLSFGSRFPLERSYLTRNILIQLILSLLFAPLHIILMITANRIFLSSYIGEYELPIPFTVLMAGFGATNVMIYWGITAVSQAINYFRKYQQRNFQLAQAELQVLKMQLHPHFLFNTINAISELVYEEPEVADQTLSQLSDLLRLSLKSGKAQEVSLQEELNFLKKYIEIQQTLLQQRLTIELKISPETLAAKVPNMILQPLVENAIRHGIAPSVNGGVLQIEARRENEMLLLIIKDNGCGLVSADKILKSGGIGISNTRERLQQLYGNKQTFNLAQPNDGGFMVSILIPFDEIELYEN